MQKLQLVELLARRRRLVDDRSGRDRRGGVETSLDLRLIEEQRRTEPIETFGRTVAGHFFQQRPDDLLVELQ